ncbi:MAG: PDZ domain-containing protein [Verrucomicrobiales bacterium]|nr:PDZ domain-containing protein [Verrucomicrobiales bacterium]
MKRLIQMKVVALLLPLLAVSEVSAQDFLDELPSSRRLNGKSTVLAFGDAGVSAKSSTLTVLSNGKAIALATVLDIEGHAVTKASELEEMEELSALSSTGDEINITLISSDQKTDLALMKVDPGTGIPVQWADPNNVQQGTWVGSMNHESETLMIGVISAKRRSIEGRSGVLGVLLDPNDDPKELGVAVMDFGPNSPAKKEGIRQGDLVIRVEGKEIKSRKDISEEIKKFAPTEEVRLKILRGEEGIPFKVTLNYMSNVFDMLDRNQRMSGLTSKRKAGFSDVLQHEIPLSPMAMGGPLMNLKGLAIGVDIARSDRVTTFALPSSLVKEIADKLKSQNQGNN